MTTADRALAANNYAKQRWIWDDYYFFEEAVAQFPDEPTKTLVDRLARKYDLVDPKELWT